MKKVITLLLLCLLSMGAVHAQRADSLLLSHSVRYVTEHWFMRQGDNFNVIDTQVEWPEVIDHTAVAPLQEALSTLLFGTPVADFDKAYAAFLADKGLQVTSELATLPDDHRFCYFTLSAKIRAREPNRWIVYDVACTVEPQALSPHKAHTASAVLVYDLTRHRLLTVQSMLHLDWIGNLPMDEPLIRAILRPLSSDMLTQILSANITQAWPVGSGKLAGLHVACQLTTGRAEYNTYVPYELLRDVMTRAGRQLFSSPAKPDAFTVLPLIPTTWQGDTIYRQVDTMPVPHGGKEGLQQRIAEATPAGTPTAGRLLLAYIVDRKGQPQDIRVVRSLTPELDRKAVETVRLMPPYSPGTHQGKTVPVLLTLPIHYE